MALAIIVAIIFSCSKENNNLQSLAPIESENTFKKEISKIVTKPTNSEGILYFKDEEHFLSVMESLETTKDDTWEQSLNFVSARTSNPVYQGGNLDDMPIRDKFFPMVLNRDYMIGIGNWVFKLDTENKLVYATSKSRLENIQLLKSSPIVAEGGILQFSFDDDVFARLEAIESRDPANGLNTGERATCASGTTSAASRTSWTTICTSPTNASLFSSNEQFQAELCMDNSGIYKNLYIRWCHKHHADKRPNAVSFVDEDDQESIVRFTYSYTKKNGTSSYSVSPSPFAATGNGSINAASQYRRFPSDDEQWTLYRGTTCLSTYNANAQVVWYRSCAEMNAYPNNAPFFTTHEFELGTIAR